MGEGGRIAEITGMKERGTMAGTRGDKAGSTHRTFNINLDDFDSTVLRRVTRATCLTTLRRWIS